MPDLPAGIPFHSCPSTGLRPTPGEISLALDGRRKDGRPPREGDGSKGLPGGSFYQMFRVSSVCD